MNNSRIITGIVFLVLGGIFSLIPLFALSFFFIWIYSLPVFIIGIIILLNKKEDIIEQIKIKKKMKGGRKNE